MRILLVEDERRMAQALCEILRVEKYEVDHYADGISGLEALESGLYDLAVLDVMLPGRDGFEVVREARKKGLRTPILMLTARGELDDKVEGLDLSLIHIYSRIQRIQSMLYTGQEFLSETCQGRPCLLYTSRCV